MHLGALVLALLAVSACGDDESQGKDAGPSGERCVSPGLTQNNCSCPTSSIPGYRQCREDHLWGQCICPSDLPPGAVCRDGQRYVCKPCEDGGTERAVTCMNGQVDCGCGMDAGFDASAPAGDASTQDDSGA